MSNAPKFTQDQLEALGLLAVCQDTGEAVAGRVEAGNDVSEPMTQSKADAGEEKQLQRLCELELSRCGIEFLHMSYRAREKRGWPDLTFCVVGRPFAIELKTATGQLSQDQRQVLAAMEANGWLVRIVRSFDDFRMIAKHGSTRHGEMLAEQRQKGGTE